MVYRVLMTESLESRAHTAHSHHPEFHALRTLGLFLALSLLALAPAQAADDGGIHAIVENGAIVWTPDALFSQAELLVRGPDGLELRRAFAPGQRLALDPADLNAPLPDGFYLYDLVLAPQGGTEQAEAESQTGSFEVRGGVAIKSPAMAIFHTGTGSVDGFLCVGPECNDYTAASGRTLVLKEDSIQLVFEDDSDAPFPTNDWEITINDSGAGGLSYFQIRDITNNRNPFRIAAGAPTQSLWLDIQGDLGVGIDVADGPIHVRRSLDSWIRFGTTSSGGYEWDVLGNNVNFIIRDAPNNRLPFRLFPGVANGMLVVNPTGVGVNTNDGLGSVNVRAELDVRGTTVSTRALIGFDDPTTAALNTDFEVEGLARFRANTRVDGTALYFGDAEYRGARATFRGSELFFSGDYSGSAFVMRAVTTSPVQTTLLNLDKSGNLSISGTLSQGSDVNTKENILAVDPEAILAGVASLPIATWEYIADRTDAVHLGPMSQDFAAAFGLGHDDTHIAAVDADGVALAAIQALLARAETAEALAEAQGAQIETLTARLARLESLLGVDHE